ncbi:dihydrolipoyl dehydrogenase family protein [Enterococcus larvae]|uniref:dihydrolipoyl dehydrogenase family protein n=1 Tax=Enterococcus larvae TaxID=2794352 RepID=UPI003F417A6F
MSNQFDVIIIGSGPGGMAAAYDLHSAGKKVAVVESDKWGGTCPNRGCDPKKILYHAVEVQQSMKQLIGRGYKEQPAINWENLMAFKEEFTSAVPKEQKGGLDGFGVETIEGVAAFEDTHTILVNGERYTADAFIIATGQRSAIVDIPGKELMETSTEFLSMPHLPKTMIFIGGGYITFELANIAHSCGSEVHILHHNERPLKGFDPEQVQSLIEGLKQKGIIFHFNESAVDIKKAGEWLTATLASGKEMTVDKIICATGRIPNLENLNLEKIGVDYSKKGLTVDGFLRTTAANIYGLGDCLAKQQPKLTPVSSFEGSYLGRLLGKGIEKEIVYSKIPTILFAAPKLAQVGKVVIEEQEKENYQVTEVDMSSWFTYKQRNESIVKAKIVIEKITGLLVGASVLSNEADQLINLMTLMINDKVQADRLSEQILLYPTVASDIGYLY